MPSFIEEKQNIVLRLIELLKGKAEFALLFGSITNDNFNIESDIDIAVYFNSEFNIKEKKAGVRSNAVRLRNLSDITTLCISPLRGFILFWE